MWFFRHKRNDTQEMDRKEAEIQRIRGELLDTIDHASETTQRLNKLLEEKGDRAYLIFLATGGVRRNRNVRR